MPPLTRPRSIAYRCPILFLGLLLTLAPPATGAGNTLRVAVISDLNGAYGSTDYEASVGGAVRRILDLGPALVISTGDMVAGQRRPHLSRDAVEAMWRAFQGEVSAPLASAGIPLAVTPGNHDASAYRGFEHEREIYREQWVPRTAGLEFVDRADYPFHYAFAAGETLFIALDATTVGRLPPSQMAWLRNLLAERGPSYRWRVVFSHLPLWPVAQGREREFIGDPELQALLEHGRVDLYLSGHHHAFYPGVKDGVVFVGQACLGASPRRLIGTRLRSPRGFTVLEFGDEGIGVAAYEGPGFGRTIEWSALPARLDTDAATLIRADLAQETVIEMDTVVAPVRTASGVASR